MCVYRYRSLTQMSKWKVVSQEEQSTRMAEDQLRGRSQHQSLTRCPGTYAVEHKDLVIRNTSSRNDIEQLVPSWWAWLLDDHSKCGIYGFLHFISPWQTSRGGCPVHRGFSGTCLVPAPCLQTWHIVRRGHFPPSSHTALLCSAGCDPHPPNSSSFP